MADMTMGGAAPETTSGQSAPETVNQQPGANAQEGQEGGEGEGDGEEPKPWEKHDGGDWDGVPMGARKRIQKQSTEIRALREELNAKSAREQAIVAELLEHRFACAREPKREDFASEGEYLRAQLKRLQMREQLDQMRGGEGQPNPPEAAQAPEVDSMRQAWMQKVESSRSDLPDYEAVLKSAQLNLDPALLMHIGRSEYGPHILYTIARNGLALDMEDMSPYDRLQMVGSIEARVRAWKARAPQPQAPAGNPLPPQQQQQKPAIPPAPPRAPGKAAAPSQGGNDWIASRNAQFGIQ